MSGPYGFTLLPCMYSHVSTDIMLEFPKRQYCSEKDTCLNTSPGKCHRKNSWYCVVSLLYTHFKHYSFQGIKLKPAESCFISFNPQLKPQPLVLTFLSLTVKGPSWWNVTLLSVVLCGFLDNAKCKRVSMGELIRAPRNVARLHLLWSLTVAPRCPLLLCCCSHPLATKRWHTTQGIVWRTAKFSPNKGLLTKQQSEKIHTIAKCWVIYLSSASQWELWTWWQ